MGYIQFKGLYVVLEIEEGAWQEQPHARQASYLIFIIVVVLGPDPVMLRSTPNYVLKKLLLANSAQDT